MEHGQEDRVFRQTVVVRQEADRCALADLVVVVGAIRERAARELSPGFDEALTVRRSEGSIACHDRTEALSRGEPLVASVEDDVEAGVGQHCDVDRRAADGASQLGAKDVHRGSRIQLLHQVVSRRQNFLGPVLCQHVLHVLAVTGEVHGLGHGVTFLGEKRRGACLLGSGDAFRFRRVDPAKIIHVNT